MCEVKTEVISGVCAQYRSAYKTRGWLKDYLQASFPPEQRLSLNFRSSERVATVHVLYL